MKIILGAICTVFILLSIIYANKTLVSYDRITEEQNRQAFKDEKGNTTIISHPQNVRRTYQENYASMGGAISFGIVAGAAIIALAVLIRSENSR